MVEQRYRKYLQEETTSISFGLHFKINQICHMEQFLEPVDKALGCFKHRLEDVPGEVSRGQEKPRDTSKIRVGRRLP